HAGRREERDGIAIGIGDGEVQGEELALGPGGGGGRGDDRRTVRVGDVAGGEGDAVAPRLREVGRPAQRAARVARAGGERGAGGDAGRREQGDGITIGVGGGDVDGEEAVLGHGGGGGRGDHRRAVRIGDGDGGGVGAGERVAGGERDAIAPRLREAGRPAQRATRIARARGERGAGGRDRAERGDGLAIGIDHGEVHGEELALGHGGGGGSIDHRRTVRVGDGDGGGAGAVERVAGGERDAVAPGLREVGRPAQRAARVPGAGRERGAGGHAGRRERRDGVVIGIGGGHVDGEKTVLGHGGG